MPLVPTLLYSDRKLPITKIIPSDHDGFDHDYRANPISTVSILD